MPKRTLERALRHAFDEVDTRLRRAGLLRIPAETRAPAVFGLRDAVLARYRAIAERATPVDVLADDEARARHYALMAPPPPSPRGAPDPARLAARAKLDETRSLDEAIDWLERRELLALLSDGALFERWRDSGRQTRTDA